MTDARGYTWAGPTPPLPRSIWVVAWASLAGQIVILLDLGVRSDSEIAVAASLLVGALVIGYVSAGVVRARTVRLVLAWLVLGLSGIAELVFVIDHASYGAPEDSEFLIALAGWPRRLPRSWVYGGSSGPVGSPGTATNTDTAYRPLSRSRPWSPSVSSSGSWAGSWHPPPRARTSNSASVSLR